MKGIYLFCTRLTVYLLELPLIVLLSVVIHFHDSSDELLKFYPLEILISLSMLFIAVYFFRFISITTDEVRSHALFSSARDREFIKEGCTLVLTRKKGKRLDVDLWAHDDTPAFDWMKDDDDITKDLRVFHGIAIAGKRSVMDILEYFTVEPQLLEDAVSTDGFSYENENVSVKSSLQNDVFRVKIKFLTTIA